MGDEEKISWRSPYSCSSERDVVQNRYCQSERNVCNQKWRNSKQMQRNMKVENKKVKAENDGRDVRVIEVVVVV